MSPLAIQWFTLERPVKELPPAPELFLPLTSPPATPTSESMMRSLCSYYNNAIGEVPMPATTPVWCTLRDIVRRQSASFIFIFLAEGEKKNKWQSNTVYANLISHASYVLPCLLGSAQLRLRGKWQCRGLIWLIFSVMIMRLSTLFVASTKGTHE